MVAAFVPVGGGHCDCAYDTVNTFPQLLILQYSGSSCVSSQNRSFFSLLIYSPHPSGTCFEIMTNIYHFFFLAGGMCWPRPSPPHLHFEFPLLSPALLQIPIHVPRSAYVSNATLARKLTLVISQQSDALVFYAVILSM
jgi:hypothetical protein